MSADALARVHARIRACTACPLRAGCRAPVPGDGTPAARLVVVGEAPGATEDAAGRPFVGRSGRLLREALAATTLPADWIFITNTVRCRPPANRAPTAAERASCAPHLAAELATLRPTALVLLGRTAVHGVLGATVAAQRLTDLRGWYAGARPALVPATAALFITYHPAAALRTPVRRTALLADLAEVATHLRVTHICVVSRP